MSEELVKQEITDGCPVCPYCGERDEYNKDISDWGDGHEKKIECECGKDYFVESSISISFVSRVKPETPWLFKEVSL